MSDVMVIAESLIKAGAPVLGDVLKGAATTAGSPAAGAIVGGIVDALKEALAIPPAAPPAEVAKRIDAEPARAAEAAAAIERDMRGLWTIEARRASEAQTAEIEKGFTAWQTMRTLIQLVVWMGWTVILAVALFGGNFSARPTMAVGEVVTAWGGVTWVWLIVFHGGHTIKEVAPALFGGGRR